MKLGSQNYAVIIKISWNLPTDSKVISGGNMDRQTEWWIDKPSFIFGKHAKQEVLGRTNSPTFPTQVIYLKFLNLI